jgi:hypothetical protein
MPSNVDGVIYGTITVGALLAAESAQRETYAETVVAGIIALLLYWLAHSYAQFTAWRLAEGEPSTLGALARTMARELSILIGAGIPLVPLLISWAADASLSSAVTAAIWTSAAMILLVEVVAGIRAEQSGRDLVGQTVLGALLGFLVIALKLVLH